MGTLPTNIVGQLIAEAFSGQAHASKGFVVGFNLGVNAFKATEYLDLMLIGKALPTLMFRLRWKEPDEDVTHVTVWETYANHKRWRAGIIQLLDAFSDRIVCLDVSTPGTWHELLDEPFEKKEHETV